MIQDFAGRLDEVWAADSIRRRHSMLAALYVGAVALFTICLVTLVEAIAGAERLPKARARRRR